MAALGAGTLVFVEDHADGVAARQTGIKSGCGMAPIRKLARVLMPTENRPANHVDFES
jgi:hypothetical protein